MLYAPHVIVMSSAFFNPSFAFSSHFDTDGAPLSELSWPSSLAVVAVSFSGLFTFVFLMLACLCCKKGDIGFKEFENTEGEDYQADLTSPSSHNGPEVYILPLTEVSLPVSKQPGRSIQLLKSSDLGRHSLLYLKELGHGWFGKVLLGEVNAGLSTTQVVVKELKASASVQEQMQFLEEVQPYHLQHTALLQCLAQCTEVTPYLLVMEFCPLGDLKSYLRSCQGADSETLDPLILQRMVCDIASGLLHLHKHNYIHSDLALRNCLLTSEMSVKIGDYGLSHSRYKEDYFITQDQIWVPLRWIAPELIDEVHGNLLVVDQTKNSNIWSLGVTMWELFELGNQPYRQFSDRQVLTYAVKEQQLKLPQPHLPLPMAERWYEVMQFCWLQPELRPSSEEVHLLVTYLCAKGSSEAEEDFEQRWNALRPNLLGSSTHSSSAALVLTPTPSEQTQVELASSASSFPLLEHFSDSFHSDTGDDLLTVTETSQGLNFEYKWEEARAEQPYCSSSTSGPLGQGNPHYQDFYYSCREKTCRGDSPTYYEPEHPGVVPVLSAHSPSVSSEYYIRIEEPVECNITVDDGIVDYSPGLEACSVSPETTSCTAHSNSYWSTANNLKSTCYDSDSSPIIQLPMEPLLRENSNSSPHDQCSSQLVSSTAVCSQQQSTQKTRSCHSDEDMSPESRTTYVRPVEHLEAPMNLSVALSSPSLGFCDPYLEASSIYTADHLRKTVVNHISIDVESDDGILMGRRGSRDINNDDLFSEGESTNWTSNHSANNNSLSIDVGHMGSGSDNYLDLQFHVNTTDIWSLTKATTRTFASSKSCAPLNVARQNTSGEDSYIHLHHEDVMQPATQWDTSAHNLKSGKETYQKSFNTDRLYSESKMIPETTFIKSVSSGQADKQRAWDGSGMSLSSEDRKGELDSGMGVSNTSLVGLGDYSEDEDDDLTDITSGIFADFNLDYANLEEEELSPIKTNNITPGSLDTLNLSSSMEQAFSPDNFIMPILPKSLDSGYDTENNESPEFLFKDQVDDQSPRIGEDFLLQVGLDQELSSNASTLHLKALTDKNPYRDSAYFSDYENERSPHEEGSRFFLNGNKFSENVEHAKSCNFEDEVCSKQDSTPGLSMLSPFPPEMGGCLTKESAPADEELGLETEQTGEDLPSELTSSASEPSSTVQEGSSNRNEGRKTGNSLPDNSLQSNCSNEDVPTENGEGSTEEEEMPEISIINTEEERADVTINEDDFEDIDADSQDSLCEESPNGPPVDLSSSSSLLELCGEDVRAPLEEAEEEDDSDDSESDEELRTYNVHEEDSEGSEEDFSAVPVVVSDCSRARHLRSLLKMPSLLTQSFCDELERKKKAVSFFDDVTVFLFDQESPTGELSDYTFASEADSPEKEEPSLHQSQQESETLLDSPIEQMEETNHGKNETFGLEDGVLCEPDPPSPNGHPEPITSPLSSPKSPESPKPASVALNRFMVSRFSITHVSDCNTSSVAETSDDSPKD